MSGDLFQEQRTNIKYLVKKGSKITIILKEAFEDNNTKSTTIYKLLEKYQKKKEKTWTSI